MMVFLISEIGFWSGYLFLIAPFPDRCLLAPFYIQECIKINCVVGYNFHTDDHK